MIKSREEKEAEAYAKLKANKPKSMKEQLKEDEDRIAELDKLMDDRIFDDATKSEEMDVKSFNQIKSLFSSNIVEMKKGDITFYIQTNIPAIDYLNYTYNVKDKDLKVRYNEKIKLIHGQIVSPKMPLEMFMAIRHDVLVPLIDELWELF